MDFQIDYGAMPLNKPTDAGPLFASVDGRVSSLANGEVVFFDVATENLHVMTEQVLGAMDVCRPFRTIDAHVAALRQAMPALPPQGDAVKRVLENLIGRGLLISDADYLAGLTRDSVPSSVEFAGIFIRACDRPAQLKRLLASLIDYEQRFRPAHRYHVIDDSRDASNAVEHRRLLEEFKSLAKVEVQYVGADAWQRVVELCTRESADGGTAEWLLRRMPEQRVHGGGLAMNLIALLAAGRRYALLDDDFVFPLRLHPEFDSQVDLQPRGQLPARFFGSVDAALAAGREFDGDPLKLHLDTCGAPLGGLLNRVSVMVVGRGTLQGATPSTLAHLADAGRVIATVNGHRGHSGSASTAWMFTLDPESRASLCADRDEYLRHIDSPSLWYGPRRTRLQAHGNFTPFVLDGSDMLPYTSPSGRSEDQLFAGLCRLIAPRSLTAHLPTSIGHLQEGERSRSASLKAAFAPNTNAYLADMALSSAGEFHAVDRGARLLGFSARLRDMAEASERTILGDLREHLAHTRSTLIHQMQGVLQEAKSAPVYWKADMRQLIEAQGKALVQSAVPRLSDWKADLDAGGAVRLYRDAMSTHASALSAWPTLWSFAASSRDALRKAVG
jgi:hypothetical protein